MANTVVVIYPELDIKLYLGKLFEHKVDKDISILSRIGEDQYCFISLEDGDRHKNPMNAKYVLQDMSLNFTPLLGAEITIKTE